LAEKGYSNGPIITSMLVISNRTIEKVMVSSIGKLLAMFIKVNGVKIG